VRARICCVAHIEHILCHRKRGCVTRGEIKTGMISNVKIVPDL
jgi:hypothetical protein